MPPPSPPPLRIGYVPEHVSTPLHFAHTHFSLPSTLHPYPSGTGHMIAALTSSTLDIAIGLTEAWITGLGTAQTEGRPAPYKLVGTYVESPLCWAISVGGKGGVGVGVEGLRGKRMGVSRVGSGSYVMGYVLGAREGWLEADGHGDGSGSAAPFEVVPLQTFEKMRAAVNNSSSGRGEGAAAAADFFLWEHYTSKRYFDNRTIRRVGEIRTPWPSWMIVARPEIVGDERLEQVLEMVNKGVGYFGGHREEVVGFVSGEMDYSREDAGEWVGTVEFAGDVRGVGEGVVRGTVEVLRGAGVLGEVDVEDMIGIKRAE